MLMYEWEASPSFPVRLSGVSDDRGRARRAAASALLGDPALAAVTVAEVQASLSIRGSLRRPTGRTWTGRREDGRVAWKAARAYPRELAS